MARTHAFLAVLAFLAVTALTTAIEVKLFWDVGERFIGHADTANNALVARNIAEGNGAVTDIVWILHGGGQPGQSVRRPEGYWSIYYSAILALFFKLFGANQQTLFLVSSLAKASIAALASYWVYRFTGQAFAATVCGLVMQITPQIEQHVRGLPDIHLALFVFLSVSAMVWSINRESLLGSVVTGLFAGAAIGIKPSGLLLVGVVPLCMLLAPERNLLIRRLTYFAAGLVCALMPLAVHNYRAAGTLWWPDQHLVKSANLYRSVIGSWNASIYDPTAPLNSVVFFSPEWWLVHFWRLRDFILAWSADEIVPLWLLPFVFLLIADWIRKRRPGHSLCTSTDDKFILATILLMCGAVAVGLAAYMRYRYYFFVAPMFWVLGFTMCTRLSRTLLLFAMTYSVIMGGYHYMREFRTPPQTVNIDAYNTVDSLLPKDAIVMTQNPWQFAFHTRRRSVVLPYNDNSDVVQGVASRYDVKYLVVVGHEIRHPGLQYLEEGVMPPYLEKIHQSDNEGDPLVIAKFRSDLVP